MKLNKRAQIALLILVMLVLYFFYQHYGKENPVKAFQASLINSLQQNNTLEDSLVTYKYHKTKGKEEKYLKVLPSFILEEIENNITELTSRNETNIRNNLLNEEWDGIKNTTTRATVQKFINKCNDCPLRKKAEEKLTKIEEVEAKERLERQARAQQREEEQQRQASNSKRGKKLHLISLKCFTKEDATEKDNIYIQMNGRKLLSQERMDSGDELDLTHINPIAIESQVNLEVYDDDTGDWFGGDDLLLKLRVTTQDAGKGEQSREGRHYNGHYRLYYKVE